MLEHAGNSYRATGKSSANDQFDNRLIFGENLLALKALKKEFQGKIKCVYIDPPFNTGEEFDHYSDSVDHDAWLTFMRDRLCLIHMLMRDDGLLFVQIDDREHAYLKVLIDEIFGREQFVSTIVWQKKYAGSSVAKLFTGVHEYILVYAKEINRAKINGLPRSQKQDSRYKNHDDDARGPWFKDNLLRSEERPNDMYAVKTPSGVEYRPPAGTSWRFRESRLKELVADNRIWFGCNGGRMPRLKRFLSEVTTSLPPTTWWGHEDAGSYGEARGEMIKLFNREESLFATSKPERLLERIIAIGSDPGDWILDCFGGAGTTGAVAQKMERRWIMVEHGEQIHSHIVPRLQAVIDGKDTGGVTSSTGWTGGGGYRYSAI